MLGGFFFLIRGLRPSIQSSKIIIIINNNP